MGGIARQELSGEGEGCRVNATERSNGEDGCARVDAEGAWVKDGNKTRHMVSLPGSAPKTDGGW